MEILSIDNIGQGGINSDISPWNLPANVLTGGVNFRVRANTIYSSGGYKLWSTPPVDFNAGYLLPVDTAIDKFLIVAGSSAVYSFDGQNWVDISSGVGYTAENRRWSGAMLGNIPVVNNPRQGPEYWSPVTPSQPLQELNFDPDTTWNEKNYSCNTLRSYKNFLFALGMIEEGEDLYTTYRWSHPADINGLPFTWDETDISGLAGRAQIGGESGRIIDGLQLRDSFIIYSEKSINVLNMTNTEFVFNRRTLSNSIGLANKNALVEIKGVHYFIGDGDIYSNDGVNIRSLLHDRIFELFNNLVNASTFENSYAVRNLGAKEIWFCVPTVDAINPNVAFIFNYLDDTWAIRTLPELDEQFTMMEDNLSILYADYSVQPEPKDPWDDWEGSWDEQINAWANKERTPLNHTVVGVGPNSTLYILDPTEVQSSAVGTRIERTNLAVGGHSQVTSINQVIPHIEGTEAVKIQFGSQDKAGGPVRWKPAVLFTPGVDRKVDIRTTGELHAYRLFSTGAGQWALSGFTIHYTPSGVR